jgi:hypothetical protein
MSNLNFTEPDRPYETRLKSFYGNPLKQMPILLSGKVGDEAVGVPRRVITPKEVLHERVRGTHEGDKSLLVNKYIHTGAAVITNPDGSGDVVIGLYSDPVIQKLVHSLNPDSPIPGYSLKVSTEEYHAVEGLRISATVANDLRANVYAHKKMREKAWDFVAEGDARLVADNLALVQDKKGGSMDNRMGWFFSNDPGLRLVCVGSVDNDPYSSADGFDLINDLNSRLVGVSDGVATPTLEQTLAVINNPNINREGMVEAFSLLYQS